MGARCDGPGWWRRGRRCAAPDLEGETWGTRRCGWRVLERVLERVVGEDVGEGEGAVEDDEGHRDEVDAEGHEGVADGGGEFHEAEAFGGALLFLNVVEGVDDVEVGGLVGGWGCESGHDGSFFRD